MLKFHSVRKNYGNNLILNIPYLSLDPGSYWLQGPNGVGKSTALKMIAGMIPFEGEIEIDGVNIHRRPVDYRRLVNYVEAEPQYPPFLNGRDLVGFFQSVRNAPRKQADLLQQSFGIGAFIKNPVSTYSSGMLKKLSLVLAFIGQPRLILLDEPLVAIDKDTIPVLYSSIRKLADENISFIIASHQSLEPDLLPPIIKLIFSDHSLSTVE